MLKRTSIMLHHSLTEDGQTVSWGAIERYHREVQGWRDIGYHGGVELAGNPASLGRYAYQAMMGRAEDERAAACLEGDMNDLALHLCFVGNYDQAPPSADILRVAVKRFILPWMKRWAISPEGIIAHHDFADYKTCPGTKFDLDVVRRMVV